MLMTKQTEMFQCHLYIYKLVYKCINPALTGDLRVGQIKYQIK